MNSSQVSLLLILETFIPDNGIILKGKFSLDFENFKEHRLTVSDARSSLTFVDNYNENSIDSGEPADQIEEVILKIDGNEEVFSKEKLDGAEAMYNGMRTYIGFQKMFKDNQ